MLEAPMKTMAFCGGGATLSASSNVLIADSQRSASAPAAWAHSREDGAAIRAATPSTASHVTRRRILRSMVCVIGPFTMCYGLAGYYGLAGCRAAPRIWL